jgi:arylsulfatase A-like enzyme
MKKPHIVLITVDQMRLDCLGALKRTPIETPNLDALIRRGVLFSSAYSATPSCIPARAAIMTGMSQRSHGRVGYQDKVPWDYEHMLAGELARAGYHTQCIGKMHVYPTRNLCGFHNIVLHDGYMHHSRYKHLNSHQESFDQVDDYLVWLRERAGSQTDLIDAGLDCNASTVSRPWHLPEHLHPTNWVVQQSIDFLRRRDPRKPFFLWASFVRPHPPLDPPQAYLDLYSGLDLPDPPVGEWADREDREREGLIPTTRKGIVHRNMRRRALAAYYALITHIDHQIGRLMNALEEYGVLEDAVILFTSDHGDMMGDHNFYRKALPYEGSARIPFILCDCSGRLGVQAGGELEHVVELRDIMPTLLDAAGAPIPGTVDGMSVLPLARGEQVPWRDYIHGEHAYGELSHHFVTNGKEKYIWFSQDGREQYFDLAADTYELRDLAALPSVRDRVAALRQRLIAELTGREEGYTDGVRLIPGRTPLTLLSRTAVSPHLRRKDE